MYLQQIRNTTILFFMIGFRKQVQPRDTADITSASLYCEIALLSASSETMTQYHPMSSIQIHCLIFLFYLAIYSIHFLERIKVCLVLNQYNLFYLTCMNVLKACNLLAITNACFDCRLLVFLIIRLYYTFLLKQPPFAHLPSPVPTAQASQMTVQNAHHLHLSASLDLLYDS